MTGPAHDEAVWQTALDWVMLQHELQHERGLDEETSLRLRAWVDADPAHRAAYDQACHVWRLTGPSPDTPPKA